jgi:PAS domain S-box-containing protein
MAEPRAKTILNSSGFGQFWQYLKATLLADLNAVDTIDPELISEIERLQITQVNRALPMLVVFHVIASVSFGLLLHHSQQSATAALWVLAASLPTLLLALGFWTSYQKKTMSRAKKYIEFGGLFLGLVWAASPLVLSAQVRTNHTADLMVVILSMIGISGLALSRVPTAVIVFTALVTSSLCHTVYMSSNSGSYIGTLFCATYGLVIIGMTLNSHFEFIKRSKTELNLGKQQDTIALLLHDFQSGSSDWLWETNAIGNLTYFSPRFASLIGRPEEALRGMPLLDIFDPLLRDADWQTIADKMSNHESLAAEILTAKISGQVQHWEMSARPIYNSSNQFTGYRGVSRDVTVKLESEQKVLAAVAAAEAASAAKSQFLAVASHELRTPINAIIGFTQILLSDHEQQIEPSVKSEYMNTILESSRHLQNLINDILDATRIERGTLQLVEQPADAAELVEIAAKMCRDQAVTADITLVLRLIDGVELVCDMTRLKQVFLNLLTNAIKFSPAGGIVNVEMQLKSDQGLILAIRDAGVGIKAEDIERIFEPFVQAENGSTRRFGGIGLGLAIARKIARLHGGDICLESQPGAGTTATLTIPASRILWPQTKIAKHKPVAA